MLGKVFLGASQHQEPERSFAAVHLLQKINFYQRMLRTHSRKNRGRRQSARAPGLTVVDEIAPAAERGNVPRAGDC
jgi:hypothetical protein